MKRIGLDATDIRILVAVQRHGQISKSRLAEIVNISATPCWVRLDRLKGAGFIRGYHADIALDRICDFTQVTVTVSLLQHRKSDFDRFEAFVHSRHEITECIATGGGMDYILRTVCVNLTAFGALMQTMLDAELGVGRYMTYIATRTVKSALPDLARLAAGQGR
ncbi:MAG: Lrp/AsnC family transcriptional regulator [Rhodobacteraceae bacterium]|nr:Lrp/AsnC family transcriptional regulator [Paracoccaceae bacterium]